MALGAWDPFREMESMRREIDRIFENFGMGKGAAPYTRHAFLPGRAARAYPLLNMSEDGENVYIAALAPGLNPESLSISVVRNQLTISGEKPGLDKGVRAEDYHRNERASGRFVRTLTLPVEVENDKVKAEYRSGLLYITLPKAEVAKPKQIQVNVA